MLDVTVHLYKYQSLFRELPDRVLNFMRSHPLMDDEVDHEGGEPVFYKRNVVFTHLVVDKISTGKKCCKGVYFLKNHFLSPPPSFENNYFVHKSYVCLRVIFQAFIF